MQRNSRQLLWGGELPLQRKFRPAFLLMLLLAVAHLTLFAQNLTLHLRSENITRAFREIEKQTGYSVVYAQSQLKNAQPVTVSLSNQPLNLVLAAVFKDQPFTYSISGRIIAVRNKQKETPAETQQTITVKGKVTDEKGRGLSAVSVVIPGTPLGAMTNGDGEYIIEKAPPTANIVFSYVGFERVQLRIEGRTTINVTLMPEMKDMDEMVIIGYGTTTKKKNTGSVSSITAEEIAKQPVANPLNALQGRVAGAIVTQANGLPGSRVTIQIRGTNTIDQTGAGAQPLYIVDGVPFNIYDNSVPATNDLNGRGQFSAVGGMSPFSVINPADIESISILKDADATAIYGTRGANGVVLITTKKGKAGKTKVDINVYQGQGKVGHFIPVMNTEQYLQMRKEAYANDGITPNATNAPDLFLWDQKANTDWQKKYLGGTAGVTDAQTTVSGGDQRTRFLLNGGYHRETPVFPGDYKNQRISTRLNVDHNSLDRRFNANISINYAFESTNLLNQDLSSRYILPPNMPLYNPDGSLFWNANFVNPESYLLVKYISKAHNLMTNTVLRYTILPGLDIKTSFGFSRVQLEQNSQNPAASKNPLGTGAITNSASFANIDQKSYILEPQATYTRDLFRGRLTALVGSTFQHALNTSLRLSGDNYGTAALLGSITGAGTVSTPAYGYTMYRYNSVFGRITYDWQSKYLLNAVVRRDGSSRFGKDNKFGNFWSVGAGWIFSNEQFAESMPFLSFGKLRASYGKTGNDQIQDYGFASFFTSSGTYQNSTALAPDKINNSTLHWQTTYKVEVGLEMAFLKNRISLIANHYRNRTPDQLGYLNLSAQTGFNAYVANFDAVIRNTGWEFELNTQNISTKDLRWTTSFNLTIPRTTLVKASPSYFYYNQNTIGKPLSSQFRYNYMGVDPSTGRPMYRDVARDTLTFTPNFSTDRSIVGYTAPELYGGMNNVISYKNFELSFFFQFNKQEGNIYPTSTPGILSSGNQTTFWLNRWTKAGETGGLPRYTTTSSNYSGWSSSDATWGDASWLRLRTVNLSYTFPQNMISRLKLDNLRLYMQAQNLWWTSKNKYVYDPETGTAMPPLRVITVGINVTL